MNGRIHQQVIKNKMCTNEQLEYLVIPCDRLSHVESVEDRFNFLRLELVLDSVLQQQFTGIVLHLHHPLLRHR